MTVRTDREDLTKQVVAVSDARAQLAHQLHVLIYAAEQALKVVQSKAKRPPAVDLTPVHSARVALERAEEAHELALADLRTASGDDL